MLNIENDKKFYKPLLVNLYSRFYPFTLEEVLRYKKILNFETSYLLSNENIKFDLESIESIDMPLLWSGLYKVKNISIGIDFIKRNYNKIKFENLSIHDNIIWTIELVDFLDDKIDWRKSYILRKFDTNLIFYVLEKHKNILDWKWISRYFDIVKDIHIIEQYIEFWNWSDLSANTNLVIDLNFLTKYKDRLDWDNLSNNELSFEMILKYPESKRWNWLKVITNSAIVYDSKIFDFLFKYFSNYLLNSTSAIPFIKSKPIYAFLFRVFHAQNNDISYFLTKDEYIKLIPWEYASKNGNLKLSNQQISDHKDKLDFNDQYFWKKHKELFTEEFIIQHVDLFDLNNMFFYDLPITNKFINLYKDKININHLSRNESFNWTVDFIEENKNELHFYILSRNIKVYNLFYNQFDFNKVFK